MTSELVKSAKAMGDLCQILNHNRGTRDATNFNSVEETSASICPHCGKKMVKHIICEGARYHVHSYIGYRDKSRSSVKCSDPNCEDNHGIGCCVDQNGNPYERD